MPTKHEKEILASANRTSSGFQDFNLESDRGVLYLDVTAQGGTTPTLDVSVEALDPVNAGPVPFTPPLAFAQVAAATGTFRLELGRIVESSLRLIWTIAGGGGQNYTFSVHSARVFE